MRANLLNYKIRQRGTAIIVALFLTALVATAAIAMIERLQTDTRRTELLLNNLQANQYAQGSVAWALDQLMNDWKQQKQGKPIDLTPIRSSINEMNGATISSIIYDAQGKFNLNNLTDTQFQQAFSRLLHIIQPNIDPATAQDITMNIVNWITPGLNNSQLDQYYEKQTPSYRVPHRAMASVSELRMVKGITADIYMKLLPYVTALPEKTKFNINSVPIPVIMSFGPGITPEMAKSLYAFSHQTPITNLDALGTNFPAVKNSPIAQSNLTITSNYFMVLTTISQGNQHTKWFTLVVRILKNQSPIVIILWQSKGTL